MTDIQDVDAWIDSLYDESNQIKIEYAGKQLCFKKRFPSKIAFQLQNKSMEEQAFTLIAMLSVSPKFTMEQAARLPQDLITMIVSEFDLDPDLIAKKKLH